MNDEKKNSSFLLKQETDSSKKDKKALKQARLAQALRANLRKRNNKKKAFPRPKNTESIT